MPINRQRPTSQQRSEPDERQHGMMTHLAGGDARLEEAPDFA
jgi:hypothetical protein